MYRQAPDHALFQGDIIVAPMIGLKASDPQLVTDDGTCQAEPCKTCGQPRQAVTALPCQHCGAPPLKRLIRRYTSAQKRIKDQEEVLAKPVLANLEVVAALVLSHCCDVDQSDYIRLAALRPMTKLSQRGSRAVRDGNDFAHFHLPEYGGFSGGIRLPGYAVSRKVRLVG